MIQAGSRGRGWGRLQPLEILRFKINSATKVKFDRASPLLFELHWLPVEQRITFKILLFVFKSLNGLAPFYLSDLISTYVPSRSLRSASLSLLHVPRSNQKTYGDRAFAVAAPRLWNALPIQMRQPGTALDTFKRSLKTLLFRQAFYRFL